MAARKRMARKTQARKYKRRIVRARNGFIITRKLPELFISNSNTPGLPVTIDPTGSCLLMGAPTATLAGTYDIPFSLTFNLRQLLNASDIANICDKYKIRGAKVKVIYNSNVATVGSAYSMPQIQYINDYDDDVPPTPNLLREKMGVKLKTFGMNGSVSMSVVPKPVNPVYQTAFANGYSVPSKSMFIDTNYTTVPHYGIKGVLSNVNLVSSTVPFTFFKFDVTLIVETRDIQ